MTIFQASIFLSSVHAWWVLEAKEGVAFPGTGVMNGGATAWMLGIKPGSEQE